MSASSWDERIQRAEALSTTHPYATDVLCFYKEVASFQKALYARLKADYQEYLPSFERRGEENFSTLLPSFSSFLSLIERIGSPPLSKLAQDLQQWDAVEQQRFLQDYWKGQMVDNAESSLSFFARTFLQTYAEYVADRNTRDLTQYRQSVCPLCQGKPQVGVLHPEGYGAKRSLICSFCLTEWNYLRILCPACGEGRFDQLFVYTAEELDYVRVETCQSCRIYIKTIDLTKNGLAVPIVDELATIPLDLWAQENGYFKLEPNLLGI